MKEMDSQDFDTAASRDVVVVADVTEETGNLKSKKLLSSQENDEDTNDGDSHIKDVSEDACSTKDGTSSKAAAPPRVGFFQLFQYADKLDVLLIVTATLCSMGHGLMLGLFSLVFGDALDSFTGPSGNVLDILRPVIWKFFFLGVASLFMSYAQVAFFNLAASRQAARIRKLYFKVIMGQDMTWYDATDSGELTARVAGDVVKIEQGIGDKVGSFLQFFSMAIGGFLIGFIKGWKLTLVILSVTPLLGLSGAFLGKLMAESATEGMSAYAKAGAIAEEVIGLIRVVVAFGGQRYEAERYAKALEEAKRVNSKRGWLQGLGLAVTMSVMIGTYALGFWYGNRLVQSGEMSPGSVVTVFFSVVFAAFGLGQGASSLPAFAEAQGSAYHIFRVIKRESEIDSLSESGEVPDDIKGDIEFDKVNFTYAGRPDRLILNQMSFKIERGKTLALVGHSGCGKSTCIQLLERFYDPLAGSVRLDGNDIRQLNVQWLRSHIGIVSQMPILFAKTIAENIAAGAGLEFNPDYPNHAKDPLQLRNRMFRKKQVTQEEIVAAAKMANAHDFIMRLPNGYDTLIGERGAQLSGGQKQRIAIARALVRNPRVMLLDEATSALDSRSERVVQEALERAAQGRSTIVIAHRLSTVQNADAIGFVEGGRIVELGTHEELLALNGRYAEFVRLQALRTEEDHAQQGDGAAEDVDDLEYLEDMPESDDPLRMSSKHYLSHTSVGARDSVGSKGLGHDPRGFSHTSVSKAHIGGAPVSPVPERVPKGGWGSKLRRPGLFRRKQKVVDVDEEADAKKKAEEERIVDPGVTMRAFKYNKFEWPLVLLGSIGQMGMGCLWPVFSVLFADVINVMLQRDDDKVRFWVLMYVVLAVIAFFFQFMAVTPLVLSGERLSFRLRQASFEAILRQEIGWFDDRSNSVGALSARLSTEANSVRNLTGERVGTMINIAATIAAGLGIAFWACPKLAAVILLVIPMVAVGGAIQLKIMVGFQGDGLKMFERAGKVASEAVEGVRTVISNNCSHDFMDSYAAELDAPFKSSIKTSQIAGLAFGWAEFFTFLMWAVSFAYGGYLVDQGEADFASMMKAISAIAFGAMMLGQAAALIPDAASGQVAATKIFRLLDRKPAIDYTDESGLKPDTAEGRVAFNGISFEYPVRKEVPVLKKLRAVAKPGQTLALVGESGCGKSTLIALTERFYDPSSGVVDFDGVDLKKLNLNWLRDQIGLVNQEPDLFKTTVANNIAYGARKADEAPVTREMIEAAAKVANAHDFIMSLPSGYDTEVGERGSQLSGGQRQRIAIARALVRNPKVLLLDEATSALDSQSERLVQEALDAASRGRTTITVAHRLATIQNADAIAVVKDGVIAEIGTHSELIAKDGLYAEMVRVQMHQHASTV